MGRSLRLCTLVAVAFLSSLASLDVSVKPVAVVAPLKFGMNAFPSVPGKFSVEDTGRALNNLAPGSILRFAVEWEWFQPGRHNNGTPCYESETPLSCPVPGPIDFRWLGYELSRLAPFGVRVILTPLAAPPFARSVNDWPSMVPSASRPYGYVAPPGNTDAQLLRWQTFIKSMVRYVNTTFPGMLAGVEVWNEQNGQYFWTSVNGPDPARYKNVLCYAFQGVRAVAPTIPVLFGGVYPQVISEPRRKLSIPEFVGRAYAAGAKNCMDSLAVHPYPELDPGNPVNGFLLAMKQARRAAVNGGDAGRTLSITEVGTLGTEHVQSDFLIRTYRLSDAMSDVDMYMVHTLYDYSDTLGVCWAPRRPKASATALRYELTGSITPATC